MCGWAMPLCFFHAICHAWRVAGRCLEEHEVQLQSSSNPLPFLHNAALCYLMQCFGIDSEICHADQRNMLSRQCLLDRLKFVSSCPALACFLFCYEHAIQVSRHSLLGAVCSHVRCCWWQDHLLHALQQPPHQMRLLNCLSHTPHPCPLLLLQGKATTPHQPDTLRLTPALPCCCPASCIMMK